MNLTYLLIYLAVGIPVGFLSGLLGIGGGAVVVPVLALTFDALGFDRSHIMQLAIGTSLACIVMGNSASAREHSRLGSVHWISVKAMAPGIVLGSLIASAVAHLAPTALLKTIFTVFMVSISAQMMFSLRARPVRPLPGPAILAVVGMALGFFSGLIGIGGAAFSVAFFSFCSVDMRTSAGTAAALGVPIAVAGTIGYALAGSTLGTLPPMSVGYIYLPAWFGISITSVLLAPLGARLAHRLPTATLKKMFVVLLLLLTARMALSV